MKTNKTHMKTMKTTETTSKITKEINPHNICKTNNIQKQAEHII